MTTVICNLCGQDDWKLRFPATLDDANTLDVRAFRCTNAGYGHHPQIVECNHCGYVYANPRPDTDQLLSAYTAVEDETYLQEREGRELTFEKHLASLEKIIGSANGRRLLDVGAYIGVFVEIAQKAGWEACGVEPSEWAVGVAQKHGLPVIQGTQDAPELAGQTFDVVTMWDVIEHVDDPAGEIQKAYNLLKPGGTLVLHTMDIDSLTARLMGKRWPWLMDMHIHYFSQATLAQMLQQKGFTILHSGAHGRYLRLGYVATRVGGLNQALGHMIMWLVNSFNLSEVAIPINFGDLFTVYARKPE